VTSNAVAAKWFHAGVKCGVARAFKGLPPIDPDGKMRGMQILANGYGRDGAPVGRFGTSSSYPMSKLLAPRPD